MVGSDFFWSFDMSEDQLYSILDENFGITKTVNMEQLKIKELQLDSLDFAQLKYLIEGEYKVKFTPEEEKNFPEMTIGQLLVRVGACIS